MIWCHIILRGRRKPDRSGRQNVRPSINATGRITRHRGNIAASHIVWSNLDVHKIILRTLTILGLIAGTSAIASASPATPLLGRSDTAQTAQVERVDYYYNHHHYKNRSWDKGHRRWRYY
jgi:hypothetical protein